jgi:hypothetical protein
MRVNLSVEISNLPKSTPAKVVGIYLNSALSTAVCTLVGGMKKCKARILDPVVVPDPAPEPVKNKGGRKPRATKGSKPVTDQPDAGDAQPDTVAYDG